jgi:hypothetical protein
VPQPTPSRPDVAVAARSGEAGYVDWPAIFAGTALAVALSFVLLSFGSAIGLSIASFEPGQGASLLWLGIASGIWFLWVAITSFGAGGYLAGRLRRPVAGAGIDEVETRDGAHGVLVWATGALVGAVLAASGVTGVVGAAGSAAGTAADAASKAVGGEVDYLGNRLLRSDDGTDPASDQTRQQVISLLQRSLTDGKLSDDDHAYLAAVVARRTGQTPEEASATVDSALAEAKKAYDDALDAAEKARVAAAIAAFVVAAALMASAATAYFAATTGGDHRDRNLPFRSFGR